MPVPIAISVNMLSRQVTIERHPRTKNGAPPHSTTGVASASCSHGIQGVSKAWRREGAIPPIAMSSSGRASAALIQNRRVMSTSSGLGASSSGTARGSRAMPQIGHSPGPAFTTSGCIGQTYSVRVAASGIAGSSAIPQDGQAPGRTSWTSGHIGQTYSAVAVVGAAPASADGVGDRCIPWLPGAARIPSGSASKRSAQRGLQKK